MSNEPEIQRWTAKRKAELVKEIIKARPTLPRLHAPTTSRPLK